VHDQPLATWARARRLLTAYLLPAVHGPAVPLDVSALHVHGEPVGVAEVRARATEFTPFAVGEAWGAAWDTTWFRLRGAVPGEWAGREVVARIGIGYLGQTGFGAEALVWEGDTPRQGISPDHDEVCVSGPAVDLLVEAAANPAIAQQEPTWPLLLPDPGGAPLFRLARAEICSVDREVEQFCRDLRLVLDLSEQLGGEGARAGQLLDALRRACTAVDPEALHQSLDAAWSPLRDALDASGAPQRHRVVAQGHAHIDTAWLWPVRETRRKCARSFSTVLSLMEQHPEFRFACSQVQHYAWMRQHYPQLYARIRERVAAGQWEPVGGMWVESDCNLAAAESLVRQVVHGKLFLIEELGVEPTVGWLPDTFGFPGTLPQILRESGMPHFVTQKISWNQVNAFPHSTFWWEGIDGSRVLTHFPPAATYNGDASVVELRRTEQSFRDHGVASSSLYLFGHGDGGGGPTRGMLDNLLRMRDVDGLPQVEPGTAQEFFARTEAESDERLATWRGELYLERHRGVFTTQGRVKRDNRIAERLLREAEMWSCLHPDGLGAYPREALDEAWKLVLLHQFHDILPGSSIHWVYEEAARDHARAHQLATRAIDDATQAIARRVHAPAVVFNTASSARREVVDIGGMLALVDVPGCGFAAVDPATQPTPHHAVHTTERSLDNGILRVTWDDDGRLTSILDVEHGREVLAAGERGNLLQLFRDHPTDYDAWEIDADDIAAPAAVLRADSIAVAGDDPLRGEVRMVSHTPGGSTITQTVRLDAGSRRLEFHTEVDWREQHRLLKVAFPVAVRTPRASFDQGFGHVERPTHENTSWDAAMFEVPAHRWADLSEQGYGVALLNDCKHGYDVRGNTVRLTLLRSPTAPDPQADRAIHHFAYALLPHAGDLVRGCVVEEAEAFDLPLRAVAGGMAGATSATVPAQVVSVDPPHGVQVSTVKKSERGEALVVRLCEVAGGRRTVRVRPALRAGAATRTDLLERARETLDLRDGAVEVTLAPFQLATLRFGLE